MSDEALQIAMNRREARQGRKGKIYPFEFRVKLNKVRKTTRPFRYDVIIQWK